MRIPLYLSVAVLAVALGIGWQDHQRLTAARVELERLAKERAAATAGSFTGAPRDSRQQREEDRKEGTVLASGFLDYMVKWDSMNRPLSGMEGEAAEEMRKREYELWGRLMFLTAAGWEGFMTQVVEAEELPESIRRDAVLRTLSTWIQKDPHGALEFIGKAPAFFGGAASGTTPLNMAIHHLAKVDPATAVDQVRHPAEALAGLMNEDTRMCLISGTAFKDPALALRLVDEMEIKNRHDAVLSIAENTETAAQKTAVLAAMRARLPVLADDKARGEVSETILRGLAGTFAYGNFGEAKLWFESAKLSPQELTICARQIQSSILRPETGRWIEWLGNKLPPEDSRRITDSMMRTWTENDHQAAADWLSSSTVDGPVKHAAIASYSETVCRYQPEVATTWALTIPPGKDRDNILRTIRNNWPGKNAASARDTFAKANGFTWP